DYYCCSYTTSSNWVF
nr:immunoglobulin light chain junction region [Macaca mulatta]MOW27484.1 immunoglobulin light chain junction region [Macaca mulatta]MOW27514.1 immunoglobulin light chain junction region [Macaca mulatta]MOW27538.1 immunoglobulin light chain junction region [Macaca mulatta]MOW27541.1 immunoglobulin light chain junction region [Macaca mulatta]